MTAYEKPVTNFNRYTYALNNPYKVADPDGRDVVFSVDPKLGGGNGHASLISKTGKEIGSIRPRRSRQPTLKRLKREAW